jgi:RND family efflux transporter MFP subunit
MTTRVIYGTSAGVVAAGAVAALLLLGSGMGGDAPTVHAQGSRTVSPNPASRAGDPTAVRTVAPTVEILLRETTQPAHVESYERTDVYAKASGFLKSVLVDIGDRVQKDQVIAELSIPEMDQELQQKVARVEQAQAGVEQAESRVETAQALVVAAQAELNETKSSITAAEAEVEFRRSEHERISELVRSRSINAAIQDEKLNHLRSAEANLTAARAKVQSMEAQVTVAQSRSREAAADLIYAQSQLKLAESDREQTAVLMQYAQVRAPYDGMIIRRWVDSGDFVTSAATTKTEPLFTVDRVDRLRIIFDLPESESSLAAVGQPVVLKVDALRGRTFRGRIQRTTGVLDSRTRTLRVEAELDERQPSLKPGMYGMITVTLADIPNALTVPTQCLRFGDQLAVVYCLVDGAAERRVVELGYSDGSRTQIIQGLEPSDQVLVDAPGSPIGARQARLSR